MSIFDKFPGFCSNLRIQSKEYGIVKLDWWGTQRYLYEQMYKGFDEGVRSFIILKCRQAGISTFSLALDIFWLNAHRAVLGALITDTGSNLIRFRATLTQYMKSIPRNMRVSPLYHNISELGLVNQSVLSYLVAGTRKKREGGDLGQGKGLNFLHATEVSSYPDEDQIEKLIDSLAETHPDRLYLYESTANGFNLYYRMWENAKRSKSQRAVFLGWWLKELYAVPRDSQIYRVYWDGVLSKEEREWTREIKLTYGIEIQPEQIAWWRWKLEEGKMGDLNNMYQEFPPTEEYAFVMSGYKFFDSELLTADYRIAVKEKYDSHRYAYGNDFVDIRLKQTTPVNAELKIWQKPVPSGTYVIGADPAYGYNPNSDRSTAMVFRCYADRLVQVAEYSAPGVGTAQFAWVLLHLVGAYRNVRVNVELTGPGGAVFNELNNVKKLSELKPSSSINELSGLQHHFYSREDTLSKSFAYHSKTTADQKEFMLNRMKDLWRQRILVIKSTELLTEMKYFARDGAVLEGRGGEHDDRVIATALAILSYIGWCRDTLVMQNRTFETVSREEEHGDGKNVAVMDWLKERGIVLK